MSVETYIFTDEEKSQLKALNKSLNEMLGRSTNEGFKAYAAWTEKRISDIYHWAGVRGALLEGMGAVSHARKSRPTETDY